MERHHSIVQAEVAAVCVGLILLAIVIATIVLLAIVLWMRHKMRERSEFTIHISRNFNNSMRDKDTPISDLDDRHSLKNETFDGLESKIEVTESRYSPFHEQTSSFIQPTPKETPSRFINPQAEENSSSTSVSSLPKAEEPSLESSGESRQEEVTEKEDIQVLVKPEPLTPPVAAPRVSTQTTPTHRPPPMIPIIKPKPYTGPGKSTDKPAIPEKPPISAKPLRVKQPVLPPSSQPVTESQSQGGEVRAKPDIKPKPKPIPRKV